MRGRIRRRQDTSTGSFTEDGGDPRLEPHLPLGLVAKEHLEPAGRVRSDAVVAVEGAFLLHRGLAAEYSGENPSQVTGLPTASLGQSGEERRETLTVAVAPIGLLEKIPRHAMDPGGMLPLNPFPKRNRTVPAV